MKDFKTIETLIIQTTPLQLQRSGWEQLQKFVIREIEEYSSAPIPGDLIVDLLDSALKQLFVKISKHVLKLKYKGKPMDSRSTVNLSPVEKKCLKFIIVDFYSTTKIESSEQENDEAYFFTYLQPILDKFQQFEINNQGLTTI